MRYYFFSCLFGTILITYLGSCHIDPVDPNDFKNENDVKDNEFIISSNTIVLDEQDWDEVISVLKDRIVVSKNAKIVQRLKVGNCIYKSSSIGPDSIVLRRKVLDIKERPNNYLITTRNADLSEIFFKYTIDTRSDKLTVKPRSTIFEETFVFSTPLGDVTRDFSFDPDITAYFTADDFVFTSNFDSSDVVNGTVRAPRFEMILENFRMEMSAKFSAEASATFSMDTALIEKKLLWSNPELLIALYMDLSLGVSGSLDGKVESPKEEFTFGGYDMRLKVDGLSGSPEYYLGPSRISPTAAKTEEWAVYTDGNIELRLTASFYFTFIGAADFAKAGFNLGAYFDPGLSHTGDLLNPRPAYTLQFEAGAVGNAFVDANILIATQQYAGPEIKYPLLNGYRVFAQCEPFDDAVFQYDPVSRDFLLRMNNSDPERKHYNVTVNGTTLKYLGNDLFDYNKDYIVQVPSSIKPVNEVVIKDFYVVRQTHDGNCYIKDNFINPNGFGNCDDVVVDAEGNDYCTFQVDDLIWMSENLRISTAGYAVRQQGSPEDRLYGRLYTFTEISEGNLCPEGWRVPSSEDWENLIFYLGGSEIAGLKMKYPSNAVWDGTVPLRSQFNAVPSGEYYPWQQLYGFTNRKAFFWSSSVGPLGEVYFYVVSENLDDLFADTATGKYGHSISDIGYSCRCVKDVE